MVILLIISPQKGTIYLRHHISNTLSPKLKLKTTAVCETALYRLRVNTNSLFYTMILVLEKKKTSQKIM